MFSRFLIISAGISPIVHMFLEYLFMLLFLSTFTSFFWIVSSFWKSCLAEKKWRGKIHCWCKKYSVPTLELLEEKLFSTCRENNYEKKIIHFTSQLYTFTWLQSSWQSLTVFSTFCSPLWEREVLLLPWYQQGHINYYIYLNTLINSYRYTSTHNYTHLFLYISINNIFIHIYISYSHATMWKYLNYLWKS